MAARHFFAALRRRNVYKVAVGYAVVDWLDFRDNTGQDEADEKYFPNEHIPQWSRRKFARPVVRGA